MPLSYTLGDAYTLDYWKNIAREIEDMGADSLCIKDMAGLLTPYNAEELVKVLKEGTKLPIDIHTHYTSGVASMTYLKAVEAGCDIIDCAMSPLAMGTSQPATEVMVETFRGTPYDTGYDQDLLAEIADYFTPIREEALKSGLLNPKVLGVDIKTLRYQVPGGMLSNLGKPVKGSRTGEQIPSGSGGDPESKKGFRRAAVSNSVFPDRRHPGRYERHQRGSATNWYPRRSKKLMMGEFGKTVKPLQSGGYRRRSSETPKPITCRPADLIEPQLPQFEKECAPWKQQDEDVLSYALFRLLPRNSSSTGRHSRPGSIRRRPIRQTRRILYRREA